MSKCTWQWKKGSKQFPSKGGIKRLFAADLIIMGDIPVKESELQNALKNPSKYLEQQGWEWAPFKDD